MSAPSSIGYTVRDLSKLLGLKPLQIQRFLDDEILKPRRDIDGEPRFTFQDLVLLRAAKGLTEASVPLRKIRSALRGLRDQLPAGRPPAGVRIAAHGNQVVVRDGGSVWNPESGQALFDFAIGDLVEKATPLVRRVAEEADQRAAELNAQEWYELGCELELTSIEEAEAAYRRALDLDTGLLDAHLNLGRLLHERNEISGAERHYRSALDSAPDDATAAFNLGVALEDLGRFEEALAVYQRAIEADPASADAFFNAARLYERFGDKANAVRCLKRYRELRAS